MESKFIISPSPTLMAAALYQPGIATLTTETYEIVQPKPTPPPGDFAMGPIDRNMIDMWTPVTLVFENTSGKKDFMSYDSMREGLALALGRVPIMSGTPVKGKVPYVAAGEGAWLCEASTCIDFQKFKPTLSHELLPASFWFKAKVEAIEKGPTPPIFSAKLNRFSCGSVVLMCLLHHFGVDGRGISDFMDLWGRMTRQLEISSTLIDSRLLLQELPPIPSFKRKSRSAGSLAKSEGVRSVCRVSIPHARLGAIQSSSDVYISKDDIFTALVWRAVVRCRPMPEKTYLCRFVNIRKLVYPALEEDAFGTFTEPLVVGPYAPAELLAMTLLETCRVMRQELEGFDSSYIKDFQAYTQHLSEPFGILGNLDVTKDFVTSSHARFHKKTNFDNVVPIFSQVEILMDGVLLTIPPFQGNYLGYFYLNASHIDQLAYDMEARANGITFSKVPNSSFNH